MKTALITATILALSLPAHAFTTEEAAGERTMTIEDYIDDFVDVPEGAINWKLLGTTQQTEVNAKTEDGFDNQYTKPTFTPEVTALNGEEITIKGFMFPLDQTEAQAFFLFGPFPLSCPYQYHVGPSLVLEVYADNDPISFSYDAITITGTLELVENDPEYGVFYRLKNAKQLK